MSGDKGYCWRGISGRLRRGMQVGKMISGRRSCKSRKGAVNGNVDSKLSAP